MREARSQVASGRLDVEIWGQRGRVLFSYVRVEERSVVS